MPSRAVRFRIPIRAGRATATSPTCPGRMAIAMFRTTAMPRQRLTASSRTPVGCRLADPGERQLPGDRRRQGRRWPAFRDGEDFGGLEQGFRRLEVQHGSADGRDHGRHKRYKFQRHEVLLRMSYLRGRRSGFTVVPAGGIPQLSATFFERSGSIRFRNAVPAAALGRRFAFVN